MKLINARLVGESSLFTITITAVKTRTMTSEGQNAEKLCTPSYFEPQYFDPHCVFGQIIRQQGYIVASASEDTLDVSGHLVVPGMVDIHVHSRDPGQPNKETWITLAKAAAKGGVTMVCDMPNTDPPTIDAAGIEAKVSRAIKSGINFRIYLGVCKENLYQIPKLLETYKEVLCGLKIYYGKTTGSLHFDDLEALNGILPRPFSGILAFHSEDQCAIDRNTHALGSSEFSLKTPQDYQLHSHIRNSATALASTKTILDWGARHQRSIHIAHLSTPQELALIASQKKSGQSISCEVAPHHLIFSVDDYQRWGGKLKMNPPVRTRAERDQLREGFAAGLMDVFATDHAPHTLQEKSTKSYNQCPSGVPGIEFFAPLLITLGEQMGLSLSQSLAMGAQNPYKLLGLQNQYGNIAPGFAADFVILDTKGIFEINPDHILSLCNWTPYEDVRTTAKVLQTWVQGELRYQDPDSPLSARSPQFQGAPTSPQQKGMPRL